MLSRHKSEFLRASLLLLAFTGMCAQVPVSSRYLSPKEVIKEQVEDDIHTSIALNAQSKSLQDWESSGYTPSDVFQGIRDLKTAGAWKSACRVLMKLKPQDLALFEPEFNRAINAQSLTCHSTLVARVRAYWDGARVALSKTISRGHESWEKTEFARTSAERTVRRALDADGTREVLKDGEISLLFDGGPSAAQTSRILDILKDEGVRAVFTLQGSKVRENFLATRRLVKSGQVLGATTFHHPNLTLLDAKSAEAEINDGREELAHATGEPVRFFRVPFAASNDFLDGFIEKQGLLAVAPTIDSEDWKTRDPQKLLKSIMAKLDHVKSGVIELHDSDEQTVQVLPALLSAIRAHGFSTVVLVPGETSSNVARRD